MSGFDEYDDASGFEPEEEAPYLFCLLKHSNGKFYEATVVDTTEGGMILEVETQHVRAGLFPEKYVDTRHLDQMDLKLFFVPHFHTTVC